MSDWLTLSELAERWRTTDDTLRRQCIANELPHMKVGAQYRISRRVVERIEQSAAAEHGRRIIRNVRRNRTYAPSGVDHFGSGK